MKLFNKIKKIKRIKQLKRDVKYFEKQKFKNTILSYPPRHVTIGISNPCDNKCTFCAYHSDDAKGNSNVYGLPYKLKYEEFTKMVDVCYKGRVPHIHICATGEPFFHKDILKMIDYTSKIYSKVSFQTNFSKKIFEKHNYLYEILKRKNKIDYITTDILSGNEDEHNEIKKGSSYQDLMNSLEYINCKSNIKFKLHLVLTKFNYKNIEKLINDVYKKGINGDLEIVNLHPYGFNKYTDKSSAYLQNDNEITQYLTNAKNYAIKKNIRISIPKPFGTGANICGSFWTRFQIWPVVGIDKNRYHENIIIGGCNAVVKGKINSLGYFFDYDNIMELWNNNLFIKYRETIINGSYPDSQCVNCQVYNK